jgi:hypothetical protein
MECFKDWFAAKGRAEVSCPGTIVPVVAGVGTTHGARQKGKKIENHGIPDPQETSVGRSEAEEHADIDVARSREPWLKGKKIDGEARVSLSL